MPLVSSTIPNLVGGISQQPAALRLTTACQDMLNTWPSVVNGLQKRPPTRHVANVGTALAGGACGYMIERNENYRYLVLMQNGDLKVLNLNDGQFQTVNFPNGKAYLNASSPVDAFRFVTFGDYTFISNNTVTVETDAVSETTLGATQTRLDPTNMATIYVTNAIANTYYTVYINDVLKASFLTNKGTSASDAVQDTGVIADNLKTQLDANGIYTIKTGSTLTITNFPANGTIRTQGGTGDKSLRAFIRDVQSFSDLPPTSPEGRIVRVAGDLETDGDDYYVVHQKGIWRETLDWQQGEGFDASTMPHVLVRESNGTWTFKRHTWMDRQVGDTESSRNPSFVGTTINDIFVYTNRLGFLADENIILSEADNYENFYRTTTAQLLDSDLIDLAVLHSNVDVLHHAVAYNRDLLLMSDRNQFRFSYANYLGQKSAQIMFSTSFNVSTRVHPVNVGNSIYFVDDRSDYQFTKMYEFFPKDNATQDDADEVSSPIPEFIKNNIVFMSASNRAKAIALYSSEAPDSIYMYKFFWAGERKAQSAWTKWTFPDVTKIYWAGFSGTFLYFLIERPTGVTLERMRLDEDVFDTDLNYELLLDRRYTLPASSLVYSAANNWTTITLPYNVSTTPEVVSSDASNGIVGIRQQVTKVSANTLRVFGDITGYTNTVGLSYQMTYEFSTFYAKQQKGQGEVVMLDGRTQIRYLTLEYHNTAFFSASVITPGRDVANTVFVGSIIGSAQAELGKQPFASGKFRLPVMSENLKARVVLSNDSPFPSAFGSAEWQGIISPKSVQRM
jgi:hypothetical protein